MIVVDTNVILDISGDESGWRDWSIERLALELEVGPAVVNDVVFAELCAQQTSEDSVDSLLLNLGVTWMPMSRHALFLAGKAHAAYRKSGGLKLNVLPDFFVGAQAVDLGVPLLTRDVRR